MMLSLFACGEDADGDSNVDGDTDTTAPDGDTEDIDGDADQTDGDITDGDSSITDGDDDGSVADGDDETESAENSEEEVAEGTYLDPWTVMPSSELPPLRDWTIKKGIVHCHSPYSHDACDDEPFIEGVRNEVCFEDCRFGMCDTRQDFVFLSDHSTLYADYEYPEVLLYKEGDTLIERNEMPVANRVDCGDGHNVIVSAGTETDMMPIGIEHHTGDTPEARKAIYGSAKLEGETDNQARARCIDVLHEAGAKVFLQHTEGWDIETILELDIDGLENYNLHQNLMDNMGAAIELAFKLEMEPETLPEVEMLLITVFQESDKDLERWSKTLAVKPMPAIVATDAHRNTFDGITPDGERLDSFRRMMHWFSNYVLVPQGETDDLIIKNAIAKGRMYNSFDYLGYPVGFDFHAEIGETVYEMGDNVPDGDITLKLTRPGIYKLNPNGPQPLFSTRILKADAEGTWTEVASGEADLSVTVGKGVYRAEVRMVPEHLRAWLGPEADTYMNEMIWIYSNPIYVGMDYFDEE